MDERSEVYNVGKRQRVEKPKKKPKARAVTIVRMVLLKDLQFHH